MTTSISCFLYIVDFLYSKMQCIDDDVKCAFISYDMT